ncbi:DUF3857 and transglutaminase domain-containing protein [Vibrio sp. SCSIO 43132]|uniref:DUF3857 domain-containing transglutaminase family protein n=1 Tax=Vibrio sp. SCSIO 43132 TaxID=2779363 RepID=UPI001CA8D511|nr:DUF3857 and transglutaminase domain-containing protein [Vibrio sp. SCSIO 43132]UAB73349.1 DUF3857 and transglutaminase domain-containing protein [Vibrio sp. SCSIO 43132]
MKRHTLPLITALAVGSSHAYSADNISWSLSNAGLEKNMALLTGEAKPTEMTQLLLQTDFKVESDIVTMTRKTVNYFPRFVDAENYGSRSIYYNPNYQSLKIISAASISPSGESKQLDPSHVQILDTSEYNTFSSEKEVVLAIPGLVEGSLSVLEYELVTTKSRMESDWSEELFTQRTYPVQQYKLDVTWDEDSPVNWIADTDSVTCSASTGSLKCSGTDLPTYVSDEQSFWRDHIDRISLGEFENWNQVIIKGLLTMEQANLGTRGLEPLTEDILKGQSTVEEKIAAILDFVSRDIRYVSRSEYGNAMTPHTIAETIENRFGDCKDKSVLLKALLEKIGLKTNLVLVSTQRTDQSKLLIPTMNTYNHVVVCFKLDGKEYCIDPTDTQTHWRYTPSWIQNKVILPLDPGYIPHTMEESRYRWKFDTHTDITFNDQGGQEEVQTRTYWGEYAAYFRSKIYEMNEEERQSSLLEQYQDVVSDLGDPAFKFEHIDAMEEKVVISSEATLSPFLEVGQALNYNENDAWIRSELSDLKLSNEHYDEAFPGVKVVSEFSYDTKGLWTITDLPPTLHFDHKFGTLKRTIEKISENKIQVRTILEMPSQSIKVAEINQFNTLIDIYSRQSLIHFNGSPQTEN